MKRMWPNTCLFAFQTGIYSSPAEEADRSKQGNLSFSHIINCLPINSVMAVFETVDGAGRAMLHSLVHPFKIYSSFPK